MIFPGSFKNAVGKNHENHTMKRAVTTIPPKSLSHEKMKFSEIVTLTVGLFLLMFRDSVWFLDNTLYDSMN